MLTSVWVGANQRQISGYAIKDDKKVLTKASVDGKSWRHAENSSLHAKQHSENYSWQALTAKVADSVRTWSSGEIFS